MKSRWLSLFVVSLALLAACSASKTKTSVAPSSPAGTTKIVSSAVLLSSTMKTIASRSARMAMTIDIFGSPNEPAGTMKGTGAFSFATHSGSFTFDIDLGTQSPIQGQIFERFVGDVLYMKLPNLGTKPWLKMDFKQLATKTGIDLSSLNQFRSQDPTTGLSYLQGVSESIEEVGAETLRGVPTTHYKATIDMAKALAKLPSQLRAGLDKALEQMSGLEQMPVEAWVDEAGRLRKMTYSIDLSQLKMPGGAAGGSAAGSVTTTLELYDYGVAVSVAPPPAAEVTDFASLGSQ